jgi:hypothetical protein
MRVMDGGHGHDTPSNSLVAFSVTSPLIGACRGPGGQKIPARGGVLEKGASRYE